MSSSFPEEPLANSIHNNTSSPSKCTATYQQPTKAENKVLIKHARLLSWASDEDGLLCIDSSEHSSLVHPQILESPRTILESPKIAGISSQQPYHLSIFHEIVRCFSMDSQDSSSTQYLSKHESSPSCNGRHRIQTSLSGIFRETSLGTAERSFIQPSQDRLRVWNQALVASIENEQNFLSSSSVLLRPDAIHRRALSVHDLFPNLRDPVRTTTTSTASTPPFGLISTNSIIQCVSNVGDYSLVKTAPSPGNAIHCRSSFKSSGTKDVFE